MPSIAAVSGQIVAAGVPVLFPDTCILLDVIRATHRCLGECVERAGDLLSLATSVPPGCLVVVSSIVPIEWNTHSPEVTDEVTRHLAMIEDQSSHFHDACRALGIALAFGRAAYTGPGLPARLQHFSKQLLDAAVPLDQDDNSRVLAVGRVVSNTPPARKGAEVKDCTILEEYLALCRQVRAAGFLKKMVFCTSNTKDYCQAGGVLFPNLAADFLAAGLVFTTNLPWAVHEVTH